MNIYCFSFTIIRDTFLGLIILLSILSFFYTDSGIVYMSSGIESDCFTLTRIKDYDQSVKVILHAKRMNEYEIIDNLLFPEFGINTTSNLQKLEARQTHE